MLFSARQIAEYLQGEIVGNPDVQVCDFAKIEEGKPQTLSFLSNPKYTHYIYETKSDIVLVNNNFIPEKPISTTLIKVENAQEALAKLLALVNEYKPKKMGIHAQSSISESATLGENLYIGAYTFIGANVTIESNSKIYPHTFIDDHVKIGKNVTIYAGVKIYEGCEIGDNCIVHAGAVIGADGFGFAPEADGSYRKIPQMGNVILEENVEIGANTTIDCAVIGSTIIRKGVKLDNLIHIAHNAEIGQHTAMAAQTGVAGSTKVGEHCVFGGQVGIGGHITIGDKVQVGAQSGIISNTKSGVDIMGSTAIPVKSFFRSNAVYAKLPDMYRQLAQLEKEIENLKKTTR